MSRVFILLVFASACGPGGGGDPDGGSGGVPIDGAPRGDARPADWDANLSGCPDGLPADFGTIEPLRIDQNQTDEYYFLFASVAEEPDPVRQFTLKLYKGRGPFAGGVQPGAYTISGDEADFQWCNACVVMYAEKDELPYAMFMASAGVIHLETVGEELTGMVENVVLRMIDIRSDGGDCEGPGDDKCGNTSCISNKCGRQVDLGTCETRIGSLSF